MPDTRSQAKTLETRDACPVGGSAGADRKMHSLPSCPTVPLHLWKLQYDGSTCVRSFLERVRELASARTVSEIHLFDGACELFTDKALDWFRVNKSSFQSWLDIESGLKDEFEQLDYDRQLVAQLRATVQGPKDSLGSFITRIRLFNKRLNKCLPEEEILEIMKCNMLPRYIQKLALEVIPDIPTLKRLGKLIELADSRTKSYIKPNLKDSGVQNKPFQLPNKDSLHTPVNAFHKQVPGNFKTKTSNKQVYYNKFNVNSREALFCFRCGRPGVKAPDCACLPSKNGHPGRQRR